MIPSFFSRGGRCIFLRRLRLVRPSHVGLSTIDTFVRPTERAHLCLHLLHQLECQAALLTAGTPTDRAVHTNPGQNLIQRRRMSGVHGGNFQAVQPMLEARISCRRQPPRITSSSSLSSQFSTQTVFSRKNARNVISFVGIMGVRQLRQSLSYAHNETGQPFLSAGFGHFRSDRHQSGAKRAAHSSADSDFSEDEFQWAEVGK